MNKSLPEMEQRIKAEAGDTTEATELWTSTDVRMG